jgi:hypothetical protein
MICLYRVSSVTTYSHQSFCKLTSLQAVIQVRCNGNVKAKLHCLRKAPLQSKAETVDGESVNLGAACRNKQTRM